MPARRRRSSFARSRGPRRKLVWADIRVDTTAGTAGQWLNVDLLQTYKGALGSELAGATVMRTLLDLWLVGTITNRDEFGLGLIVADLSQVTAAPTTSTTVVNPADRPYAQWMWNEAYTAVGTAGYNAHPYVGPNHVHLDVRSRRKIDEIGMTLILSLKNQTAAATLSFIATGRILLAMP